jgi:putative inorganic carbon (hco3(-)) transporter
MLWLHAVTLALAALLPVAVWPGATQPFSSAKLWLLLAGSGVIVLLGTARALGNRTVGANWTPHLQTAWLPAVWLASWLVSATSTGVASPDGLWLALAGPLWYGAIVVAGVSVRRLFVAYATGTTVAAFVAVGQALHADPFALAGWAPVLDEAASERLRVFGTFGNPNFVAAAIVPTLALTAGLLQTASTRTRMVAWAAAAGLQGVAVVATGSRGGALGLAVVAASLAMLGVRRSARWAMLSGAVAALSALIFVGSQARPLERTIEGRLYIWRVAMPHVADRPWLGHGPGMFALEYPGWEAEAWQQARVAAGSARFRGPQAHAHNDYVEALVDRGLLGLVTIVLLMATPLQRVIRQRRAGRDDPLAMAAAAAAAALGAMALVDFPLARPAESAMAWMLAASASRRRSTTACRDTSGVPPGPPSVGRARWTPRQ